ncbi:MAG: 4Fe-4S binding protein [Promethearchaeota archaeon]
MASNTKSATAVIRKPKQQTLRVPKLDVLKCNKCGICVEVCPQNVFIHNENGTYHQSRKMYRMWCV